MVQIDRVEAFLVDLPTIRPHVLSMATMRGQTLVLVKVHGSDGVSGVGEATTIGGLAYGEESPEGIRLVVETYLTPLLLGSDPRRPAEILARISSAIVGNRFAKCAVEIALLDAQAKRLGVPLSELIGGRIHDSLPVLWTLASGATDSDIAEAEAMIALRRHNAFKLKIGRRELASDVAHVAAIKRALGEKASVRVDVNMAWSESDARRGIAMLADAGCELVEQPISRHNRDGMARLAAASPIPLMADEALHGPEEAYALAACHAADVFALKIAQSGGLFAAMRVAAIAQAAGIGIYGGTMLEGGIGTIASAQLFCTLRHLPFGTELFGPLLLVEEILQEPLIYADFSLRLPATPGLGITLDDDKLAFFRRDRAARNSFSIPASADT